MKGQSGHLEGPSAQLVGQRGHFEENDANPWTMPELEEFEGELI